MRVTILPEAVILTEYCLSTASEEFLIFITQLYIFFVCIFYFALSSDEPE